MLDPHLLRRDPTKVAESLRSRGFVLDVQQLQALEDQRKSLQTRQQALQQNRNLNSKKVGKMKASGGDVTSLVADLDQLGRKLTAIGQELQEVQQVIASLVEGIPNIPHTSVPPGDTESDNVEVRKWGQPAQFSYPVRDHVQLGEDLGMLNFELATKLTGSRFVVMTRDLARLQRALTQFMLDLHITDHGYEETYVPYMVNSASLFGTGQLPKFEEELYKIPGDKDFYLIPTAEVPVTNFFRDQIIKVEDFPIKCTSYTPCFRREAGSYGKEVRGLNRLHQFEKVEIVQIQHPKNSYETLDSMVEHVSSILEECRY